MNQCDFSVRPVPLNIFTCVSLGDHVGDLVNYAVLICFQLCSSVSKWQINRDTHITFDDGPL